MTDSDVQKSLLSLLLARVQSNSSSCNASGSSVAAKGVNSLALVKPDMDGI